jgi:hypothetical protein
MRDEEAQTERLKRKALDEAANSVGATLICINQAEQALDHVIFQYFKLEAASLTMLPFMDFRSKVTLVKDDELLRSVLEPETVKRLHALYDQRNVIAHGYFDIALPGDPKHPADGSNWRVTHARRGQSLTGRQVKKVQSEAMELIGLLLAGREEIEEFLHPLAELRAHYPHLSPKEFIAFLKEQFGDEQPEPEPDGMM